MDHAIAVSASLIASLVGGLFSLGILGAIVWLIVLAVRAPFVEADREKRVAEAARARKAELQTQKQQAANANLTYDGLQFPCGITTGILRSRGHFGAPPAGIENWMREPDLAQGLLTVGPPGTGKTLTAIIPFVQWVAMVSSVGIFAPATKRDFADVLEFEIGSRRPGSAIYRVGPGFLRWNLMESLAPDAVAGFIRTVGERKGGAADSTWSDAATSHAQSCSLLLWALTAGGTEPFIVSIEAREATEDAEAIEEAEYRFVYDFVSLHRLANVQGEIWAEVSRHAKAQGAVLRARGDEDAAEQIEIALESRSLEFDDLADKTRSSVLMNINSVLGPLVKNLELRRTFATQTDVRLSNLDDGATIILDIDMDAYRGSAEFLFMLAFEQFSGYALRRMKHAPNYVAFIGDEFQQYASERSVDFFALSRQAKIVPCLAFQTVSRLIAKVGKKENAHAILSTFGSSLWFPTIDPETLQFVTQVIGSADVERTSTSTAEGENRGDSRNTSLGSGGGGWGSSSGTSTTTTTSMAQQQRAVVDGLLMRTLKSNFPPRGSGGRATAQAVGFLRVGGKIVDDVVTMWGPSL